MIILIRHSTPQINYEKCNYPDALKRLNDYNATYEVNLSEINTIKKEFNELFLSNNKTIISSTSPRAISTCKALFKNEEDNIIFDNNFVEFDLKIFPIHLLQMKVRNWFFISRLLWFVGINNSERNFKAEKERARKCTEFLEQKAKSTDVFVVAHGMLNHYIEKNLKEYGWEKGSQTSNGCFSIKTYNKL